ncbi:MAG: VWA domain-containing protein [Terriglobia bacterium]
MPVRILRPKTFAAIAIAALSFAVAASGAFARSGHGPHPAVQPPPAAANAQNPKIKVNVNLVNVLFTVTNKKKRLVTGLTKSDFEVFEDNRPQTITFFGQQSDLPLRIGVLLDTSNSVRERLAFEKQAASDFLNDVVRPGHDQAFVVAFDAEPQMLQDYTDDVGKLSDAIRQLQAGGGTGLFDALYYACQQKMVYSPEPQPYLRRVLIVLSDGRDNESQHSMDEALAMAQRAEAVIFAISTNRSGIPDRGDQVLKFLAEQTGGRAFFPFQASDLTSAFQGIAKELRSQYSLAYVSTDAAHDGTFRTIRIKPRRKGLRVSARSGYFAPAR